MPLVVLGIVAELLVARHQGRSVYRLRGALADVGCGLVQQLVSTLLASTAVVTSYEWLAAHRFVTLPSGPWTWVATFLGVELAAYAWHRASHSVNFLWAAHAVHHHSADFNLATALRQPVATWLTSLPFYWPLALMGVPTKHFLVMLGFSALYDVWLHTQLVPPLGWFERLLNTPALHRVHHAVNGVPMHRNYGAVLSVWDQLFGTFQPETEPCHFGPAPMLDGLNPLWAQVEAFVALLQRARRAPSPAAFRKVLLGSPAESGERAWAQPGDDAASRDDLISGTTVQRYALVHWAALVLLVVAFGAFGAALSVASKVAISAFVLLTLASIPALLERRPWATPLEAARLVFFPPLAMVVLQFG